MKKVTTLGAMSALLLFLSITGIHAQSSVKNYVIEKTTGESAHVFSGSAQTFNFTEGDTLTYLYLAPGGEKIKMTNPGNNKQPAMQTGIPLGFNLPFDTKTMTHFGITAGGFVFLGENEKLYPYTGSEIWWNTNVKDYIRFQAIAFKYKSGTTNNWEKKEILAGVNAAVCYEIVDQTLYIEYRNLKIFDKGDKTFLPISFQYILSSSGDVKMLVINLQPTGVSLTPETSTGDADHHFAFSLGLVATTTNLIYLADLDGKVNTNGIQNVELTHENYPEPGTVYSVHPDRTLCAAIEHPEITDWDYSLAETSVTFGDNLKWKDWREGQKAVFVLSEEETLSGGNLPVNGSVYSDGASIGNSKNVLIANVVPAGVGYRAQFSTRYGQFSGFEQGKTYYIHFFPYNDDCTGGPVYNTTEIPQLKIRTPLTKPLSASVSNITQTSFRLNITTAASTYYVAAVSPVATCIASGTNVSPLSYMQLESRAYTKGEKISFTQRNNTYELEILEAKGNGPLTVSDLQSGDERYFYVWSVNEEQDNYSAEPLLVSASTLRNLPDTLDFATASDYCEQPAGWTFGTNDQTYVVKEEGISGKKGLCVPLKPVLDGETYVQDARSEAVSPVMNAGEARSVSVNVRLCYYKSVSGTNEYTSAKPNSNDVLTIQYKGINQSQWSTMGTVDKNVSLNKGIGEVKFFFRPQEPEFQLRFVTVSGNSGSEEVVTQKIIAVEMEEVALCYPVYNVHTVDSLFTSTAMAFAWQDSNTTQTGYSLRYRENNTANWTSMEMPSSVTRASLTRLEPATVYQAEIRALCGGQLSDEVLISANTLDVLPFRLAAGETIGLENRKGEIPASGDVRFTAPAADKSSWVEIAKGGDEKVLGISDTRLADSNLWLVFNGFDLSGARGTVRVITDLSAAGIGNDAALRLMVSKNGSFNAGSAVKTLALNQTAVLDTTLVNVAGKFYLALYTEGFDKETEASLELNAFRVEVESLVCEPVSNIRQSNLGKTSVDLSWDGESYQYRVFYRIRSRSGEAAHSYDTLATDETFCTLENLEPGTAYEYVIVGYCESGFGNPSEPSEKQYFNTVAICRAPELFVREGSVTDVGVTLYLNFADEPNCVIRIYAKDSAAFPRVNYLYPNNGEDTVMIDSIAQGPDFTYLATARTVCAIGDSSIWGNIVEFTTLEASPEDTTTAVEAGFVKAFKVFVRRGRILVENPEARLVREVAVYSMDGRLQKRFAVNRREGFELRHDMTPGAVIIRLLGEGDRTASYKAVVF